ncbi:MAG TPA: DUF805 domain-containing protein [Croceicoccus sp.]|nr:DUF805 domain-containing protein [Croceicoccus sp.]
MDWMLLPYARYFDFAGRSRRMEYWMFQLFIVLGYAALMVAILMSGGGVEVGEAEAAPGPLVLMIFVVASIWAIATVIPTFALTIRRLHDTNRSGFWILIGFVPIVGGLVLLYFMLIEGTRGPNLFGADPKEGLPRGV